MIDSEVGSSKSKPKPQRSIKARAIDALSRREYSRSELAKKLAPHAASIEQLETLLDALEKEKLLSNARFAESLVHRRADRFGGRRIVMELEQHGLSAELVAGQKAALKQTEAQRCREVWDKKFGKRPDSLEERARQTRFLAARGFDGDCIRRVMNDADRD